MLPSFHHGTIFRFEKYKIPATELKEWKDFPEKVRISAAVCRPGYMDSKIQVQDFTREKNKPRPDYVGSIAIRPDMKPAENNDIQIGGDIWKQGSL